jgi:dienelactone hydrolase
MTLILLAFAVLATVLAGCQQIGIDGKPVAVIPQGERQEKNWQKVAPDKQQVAAIKRSALRHSSKRVQATFPDNSTEMLDAFVVIPPGDGPFPLALISHGSASAEWRRKRVKVRNYKHIAEEFARRGYLALAFTRRNYGRSTGEYAEGLGVCSIAQYADYMRSVSGAADDYRAMHAAMTKRHDVDPSQSIALGISGGGIAVIALAANPPEGLVGVLNIAGGRGSLGGGNNWNRDAQEQTFATFGQTVNVPSLWVYSYADRRFPSFTAARSFQAYTGNGAPARFESVGDIKYYGDGHAIFSAGNTDIWRPLVDDFLADIGAPTWAAPPTDKRPPDQVSPPGLSGTQQKAWDYYLGAGDHRVFVLAKSKHDENLTAGYKYAASHISIDEAKKEAREWCETHEITCEVYSIDGRAPPADEPLLTRAPK